MANHYALARSNYFQVKDTPAFEAFCAKWGLRKITKDKGRVGFLVESEDGLATDHYYAPATGDIVEANFEQELAAELELWEIAVVMQIGWETHSAISRLGLGRSMPMGKLSTVISERFMSARSS